MQLRRRLVPAAIAVVAATAVVLPLASVPASAAPAPAGGPSSGTYVALGDSVPAGSLTLGFSYVDVLAGRLGSFDTVDLSVGGATTSTLISGQLPTALSTIAARRADADPGNDVRLVTVTIGGNDVFRPVTTACAGGLTPTCQLTIGAALQTLGANWFQILGALRTAAGPDATIAAMTYYNSILPPCPAAAIPGFTALADQVLEGGPLLATGVNDLIRSAAAAFGAVVVETEHVIGPKQLVGDCLHPTAAGQQAIGNQFHAQVARYVRPPA